MNTDHVVLDGFAGTGVGVALQRLGVPELGIEVMPEAIATREANGMKTIYEDIWDAHLAEQYEFDTAWLSPPCQKFSLAGGGEGRKALDDVIDVIRRRRYRSIEWLKEESVLLGDDKIGLVLTPLFYAYKFRPTYFILEQVPPVLPVWEAMAEVLRLGGYSVWTGLLQAEMYGVPQTRKRAILIARKDGKEARPPRPTHSRYYARTPERLDVGVHKWISMAEALGWRGLTDRPAPTITGGGTETGGAEPIAKLSRYIDREEWVGGTERLSTKEAATLQSYPPFVAFTQNNKLANQAVRGLDQPAPTVTAGHDSGNRGFLTEDGTLEVATPDEVATLQSYPPFIWKGAKTKQFLQIGNASPPLMNQAIFEEVWSK